MKTSIGKLSAFAIALIILTGSYSTVKAGFIDALNDSNIVQQDTVPKIDSLVIEDIVLPDSLESDSSEIMSDSLAKIEQSPDSVVTADTVQPAMVKRRSPAGAMWRSFIFPGWGQLYNRKYVKSLIIGGGEIALIAAIYIQEERRKDAKKAGDDYSANFYRNDRQRMTWWLAGVVLYSMADAYVDAQLADFDIDENLSAGILPGFLYVRINF